MKMYHARVANHGLLGWSADITQTFVIPNDPGGPGRPISPWNHRIKEKINNVKNK